MNSNWRVVVLLCLVTGVAYLVRTDIAVAQERMAPALRLTMADMGTITAWSFQLSYALLQVPAGMFGERYGARTALAIALLGCSLASLTTGFMPEGGAAGTLVTTRILLGVSQAAVFPVAAMAVSQYVASGHRVRANALYISASSLGAAVAPLLMAPVKGRRRQGACPNAGPGGSIRSPGRAEACWVRGNAVRGQPAKASDKDSGTKTRSTMDWFEAAAAGDTARVMELLAQGADVDASGRLGRTALSLASASGHIGVVEVCLSNKANPNLRDTAGVSALMLAAHYDRHVVVKALLAAAADPQARDIAAHDTLWHGTHREIDFVLPYPRGWHGTLFVRRLFATESVRLIRQAMSARR